MYVYIGPQMGLYRCLQLWSVTAQNIPVSSPCLAAISYSKVDYPST